MPHYRAEYRALVRQTLLASSRFSEFTTRSAWVQNISAEDLPILAVATPGETKERDSFTSSERETTLHLVIKRRGDESLEEILDDDSAAAEILLLDAFRGQGIAGDLTQTQIQIDGTGEQRVGSLTMTFRIRAFFDEPLTL